MATKKPRINVTLNQRTFDIIKSMSGFSGKPMSSFISEMLDAAMPTLERMAVTFQAIKSAQDSERSKFIASMDRVQSALEPAVMEAVGQFDLFLASVEASAAGATAACEEAVGAVASNPRPVTRGSTPLKRKKSAASTTTTKARSAKASGRKS